MSGSTSFICLKNRYPGEGSFFPPKLQHGYNSHIPWRLLMRTVNVATLKNQLSKYITYAKAGEEVIIRDRNLPVAKLVPFSAGDATEQELRLVAEGKLKLPTAKLDLKKFFKMRAPKVSGHKAIEALLADREEGR
jgi:prevent-host-death family protein